MIRLLTKRKLIVAFRQTDWIRLPGVILTLLGFACGANPIRVLGNAKNWKIPSEKLNQFKKLEERKIRASEESHLVQNDCQCKRLMGRTEQEDVRWQCETGGRGKFNLLSIFKMITNASPSSGWEWSSINPNRRHRRGCQQQFGKKWCIPIRATSLVLQIFVNKKRF